MRTLQTQVKMWKRNLWKKRDFICAVLGMCLVVASTPLQVSAEETEYPTMEEYISGSKNANDKEQAEEDYVTVYIETEEDFLEFAENCRLDSWSIGKKVELKTSIELTDENVQIPVFAGIFDGNGYTISYSNVSVKRDNMGLFRYLQEGALVRNLNVSANVVLSGSQSAIGGIVGRNFGTIKNCVFTGLVEGDTEIGGIVGVNESTGQILDCRNAGVIIGYHSTGGIVGNNHGLVEDCENTGEINTHLNEISYDMEDMTLERLEEINSTENLSAHIDTGGIAGISDGWIEDCENKANIGYEHVGYNIGGIVGRMQQGTVKECENTGLVQGRKDVGGIAGQMEPFMQIEYMNDKMTKLDEELDVMLDLMETLTQQLGETGDEASVLMKNISANLRTATAATSNLKNSAIYLWNVYNGELTGMSNDMEAFAEKVKKWEDSEGDSESDTENDGYVSGGDVSGGDLGNWDDFFGDGWENNNDYTEYVETVTDFVEKTGNHLKNIAGASGSQTNSITTNLNTLDIATTAAVNDMDKLAVLLEGKGEEIEATSDQISEQAKLLRELTSEIRDDLFAKEEVVIEDASEEGAQTDTQEIRQGLLEDCTNLGTVFADTCVGGVVGQISLEYDLDPEEDIEVKGDVTTEEITSVRAVVRRCLNEGNVTSKKDYAGGIVGRASYGTVFGCQSYGTVESTGGSVVGGIAGYFTGTIRGCYSLCELVGTNQVGGVAGIGKNIFYCITMVQLEPAGKEIGSIAGNLIEGGTLYGNCFVDNGIGGVDSISYYGGAMSIPYGELRAFDGVPEKFSCFTITFIMEGKEVQSVQCGYGERIDEDHLPVIPEKEGYYGRWPEESLIKVTGNKRIEAEYLPWVTSLKSGQNDENGKSVLLVEGEFLPGYELKYIAETGLFGITNGEEEYTGPVTVRYLMSDTKKEWIVKVWKQEQPVEVESAVMGSYLVFEMDEPVRFTVEEVPGPDYSGYVVWIVAGALGVAVVAAIVLVSRKVVRRKKR